MHRSLQVEYKIVGNMASPNIEFIYKIVDSATNIPITPAKKLPDNYILPTSDLDEKSGFVHMSTKAQVSGTLNKFFATSTSTKDFVYLLKAPLRPLEQKGLIRWEAPDASVCGPRGGEGMFAHIYDDRKFRLSHDEIESAVEVVSEVGQQDWTQALSKIAEDGWFV